MSYELRIEMAKLGWNSEDQLTTFGWGTNGERGYTVWFERWDWHGVRLGVRVSFACSVRPSDLTPARVDQAWEKCARVARKAWEAFPDCIPRQDEFGNPCRDETLTKIVEDVHGGNPWRQKEINNVAG